MLLFDMVVDWLGVFGNVGILEIGSYESLPSDG
jgi:hypothetical protein